MTRSPRTIAIGIISSLAFFLLAIFGWGGFGPFFSHAALTVLVIAGVALAAVGLSSTAGNLSPGEREDRSNRWVLAAFSVLALLGAYLPAYTDRIDFWTIDGDAVRWIGVVLFAGGGALRIWPVFVLGHRFSGLVAIQPGHTLVTTSIYRVIRHPSYLGLLISVLGWGLAFRSLVGVLLGLLNLVPLVARMNAEEALLRSEFGAAYDTYRSRTSRLLPGIY
jgi:protein-S-isoprenylcysteine O-methyltransferase Ste14